MTVDLAANVVASKGKTATAMVPHIDHSDDDEQTDRYDGRYDALTVQVA